MCDAFCFLSLCLSCPFIASIFTGFILEKAATPDRAFKMYFKKIFLFDTRTSAEEIKWEILHIIIISKRFKMVLIHGKLKTSVERWRWSKIILKRFVAASLCYVRIFVSLIVEHGLIVYLRCVASGERKAIAVPDKIALFMSVHHSSLRSTLRRESPNNGAHFCFYETER